MNQPLGAGQGLFFLMVDLTYRVLGKQTEIKFFFLFCFVLFVFFCFVLFCFVCLLACLVGWLFVCLFVCLLAADDIINTDRIDA